MLPSVFGFEDLYGKKSEEFLKILHSFLYLITILGICQFILVTIS